MRHRKGISSYQIVGSNPKMVVSVEIKIPNLHQYIVEFKNRYICNSIILTIYAGISLLFSHCTFQVVRCANMFGIPYDSGKLHAFQKKSYGNRRIVRDLYICWGLKYLTQF